jgi:hypothetical protein
MIPHHGYSSFFGGFRPTAGGDTPFCFDTNIFKQQQWASQGGPWNVCARENQTRFRKTKKKNTSMTTKSKQQQQHHTKKDNPRQTLSLSSPMPSLSVVDGT